MKFNGYSEKHANVENTVLNVSIQDYFAKNVYTDDNYDIIDFLYNDSVITLSYPFYDLGKYISSGILDVYNDGTNTDTDNTKNYAEAQICGRVLEYNSPDAYNTGRIYVKLSGPKIEEYVSNDNIIKTVYKDAAVYYKFKTNAEYPKILNMKLSAEMKSNGSDENITQTDYNTSEILYFMFGTNNDEAAFTFNDNVNNTNDTINSDFGYNKDSFEQHEIFSQ